MKVKDFVTTNPKNMYEIIFTECKNGMNTVVTKNSQYDKISPYMDCEVIKVREYNGVAPIYRFVATVNNFDYDVLFGNIDATYKLYI